MAFEFANFKEVGGPGQSQQGGQSYTVFSTTDTIATMLATGYLDELAFILNVRDTIALSGTDGSVLVQVTVSTPSAISVAAFAALTGGTIDGVVIGGTTPAAATITSLNGGPLAGLRNRIINGNFDIWQRGTSGFGHNVYSADRWKETTTTTDVLAISRQAFTPGQTDVPGEPEFFLRAALTAGSSGLNDFRQFVENVRTFAGQTITLSYFIKGSTTATVANRRINQDFGSGGSSAVSTFLPNINVTTSFQKIIDTVTLPSISGKTIGTSSKLDIVLSLPSNTTVDIDIAQV